MNASDRDRFVDELLEASLRRYRSEEPRAGLEARILAGVRASEDASQRPTWAWALGVTGAALAVIVIVLAMPRRQPVPGHLPMPVVAVKPEAPAIGPRAVSAPPKAIRRGPRAALAPRRPEQFPTPAPLSEEEKLLLAYASQVPISELDNLINQNPKIEPVEIPELKIPRIEIEGLPKLGE